MRVAALDLGTNTFLCLIADVDATGLKVVSDHCEVVRIGQGVDATKSIHPGAMVRAEECFKEFSKIIAETGVTKTVAVATSAVRDVTNRDDFFALCERYKIPAQVISGDKEAELTFLGATSEFSSTEGVAVVDVGGGSTEIICQQNGKVSGQSLDIGSVRLTERWITSHPNSEGELHSLKKNIIEVFSELEVRSSEVKELVAVAGTPTTLAAMHQEIEFSADSIQGFHLSEEVLGEWIVKMSSMNLEERLQLTGLQKGREDVIVAGAMILQNTLKHFGLKQMTVSTRGVRYGLAIEAGITE